VQNKTAESISDVLGIVTEARIAWQLRDDEEIWFRGEDSKHSLTTLQPKLYRDIPADVELVSKKLLEMKFYFHEEFSRCGTQLYDHDDVDDWDWYFLMQHHGAPTRLLDWSDGALMGVHFAVNGDLKHSEGAVVYLIDPYQLIEVVEDTAAIKALPKAWHAYRKLMKDNGESCPRDWDQIFLPGMHSLKRQPAKPEKKNSLDKSAAKGKPEPPALPPAPLVLEFPQITRRVAAQRSRFMVYGRDKNWLTRWAQKPSANIWRISIPKRTILDIRIQLRDAGITESVIFPDLDGLGRELDQLWNSLKGGRSSVTGNVSRRRGLANKKS
jgi:FRG domain